MAKKKPSLLDEVLEVFYDLGKLLPKPLETKYAWAKRLRNLDYPKYQHSIWRMQKRGLIKVIEKNSKKFIQLTKKGQLEALLLKTKLNKPSKWDGKWRLIIFDIPEGAREKRDHLRFLLKKNNFFKLQASVFINPYPLNREAITYLQTSGLIDYIRILRVDELDNDRLLQKHFYL